MRVGAKAIAAAIDAIDRRGVLLLYPLANRPDPPSLWGVLPPRAALRWVTRLREARRAQKVRRRRA